MMKNIKMHNCDNLELMCTLPDESIDVICIDPPYLYLKGQKLESPFDETQFFTECKRLLTKNGFVVMFGRGTSFYRWNTILDELGFTFKEEIIWDKRYTSSPVMPLSRCHESVSIWAKGTACINQCLVPYVEMKSHDFGSILQDVKRLKSALNNTNSLNELLLFVESKAVKYSKGKALGYKTTLQSIKVDQDRSVKTLQAIDRGLKEKSIITQKRDHYNTIHPTQKPVRLIERLLALVIPDNKPREQIVVADFFAGSMSTMEAVYNMGMVGIATEIDSEYFESGRNRIINLNPVQKELF